jgi:hypothetical protein
VDDFEPDGTLYSVIALDGRLLTVEPNHGQVISVTKSGEIRQVIDISASEGHIVPEDWAISSVEPMTRPRAAGHSNENLTGAGGPVG